jgi:hypothetical protein
VPKDPLPGLVNAGNGGVVRLAGLQSQEYLHLRPQPNSMLAEL